MQPVACRVHLFNQARKAQKPPKVPFWHDHFALDGILLLKLPNGSYVFEIERGPEYRTCTGHFTINENAKDSKTVELNRFVDMSKEGWWSGDLEVVRPPKDVELLMRADDLHLAEVVDWGHAKGLPASPGPAPSRWSTSTAIAVTGCWPGWSSVPRAACSCSIAAACPPTSAPDRRR